MELRVPVLRVEVYCLGFGAYDVFCKGVAQLYGDFVLEPCRLDVSGVLGYGLIGLCLCDVCFSI